MLKKLLLVLVFNIAVFGFELEAKDRITLKTGDVYTGTIVVRDNEVIMIQTDKGQRFQFQTIEVIKIEKINDDLKISEPVVSETIRIETQGNICGWFEMGGAKSVLRHNDLSQPVVQCFLSFGTREIKDKNIFLGLGVGLVRILGERAENDMSYLPVFLSYKYSTKKNNITPFLGLETGVALSLNSTTGTGIFSKFSVGVSREITTRSAIFLSFFCQIQTYSGNISETNEFGTYSYWGVSSIQSLGLNAGIKF